MDALLGAAALGDIGTHFHSPEPKYKDISSIILLRQIATLLQTQGWQVGNIDATIVAEHPRLSPFVDQMRERICETLGVGREQIGVKATTTEGLGFAGRGEGIAAYAIALVERKI
jgi:2-C-methyl-D-erythritol 2,4-cyclodiphosphate synthase